jgi:hypothetical protein
MTNAIAGRDVLPPPEKRDQRRPKAEGSATGRPPSGGPPPAGDTLRETSSREPRSSSRRGGWGGAAPSPPARNPKTREPQDEIDPRRGERFQAGDAFKATLSLGGAGFLSISPPGIF